MRRTPLPASLALLRFASCLAIAVLFFIAESSEAQAACGGKNQRACCTALGEKAGNGKSCADGLQERAGCSGNCTCGGINPGGLVKSLGTCEKITSCGGKDQRACCLGTGEFASNKKSCGDGLYEESGCSGDCQCGGAAPSGVDSNGRCRELTECGDPGQRACCDGVGEEASNGKSCENGAVEVPGCEGNCQCGNTLENIDSNGTCFDITDCGGLGERACCAGVGESAAGTTLRSCEDGLVEQEGCTLGNCYCGGAAVNGTKSNGICVALSSCGGPGERACCVSAGESASETNLFDSCEEGTTERPGCDGNCLCGGDASLGQSSSGTCEAVEDCGGENQRACCTGQAEYADSEISVGRSCDDGFYESEGCEVGNCQCGGSVAIWGVNSNGTCKALDPCGGPGERACCASSFEFADNGVACEAGHIEVPGCESDNCQCGGTAVEGTLSNGRCVEITDCGKEGERGCCSGVGETAEGTLNSCEAGMVEDPGCDLDNCFCGGAAINGTKSNGICVVPSDCGGPGQRACCVSAGESASSAVFDSCESGTVERPGCDGECLCGGDVTLGQSSDGICEAIEECGGENQRACCTGQLEGASSELPTPRSCDDGFYEVTGCEADNCQCGGSLAVWGVESNGTCKKLDDCGGPGERACCVSSLEFADNGLACADGYVEIPGCESDNCQCGGTALEGTKSNGRCVELTECGGLGQRACCTGTAEFSDDDSTCDEGLVEQSGCDLDNCYCGGAAINGIQSSGICITPTECGGEGERACCTGTLEEAEGTVLAPCEEGLIEKPGCDGNCVCNGETALGGEESNGSCVALTDCGGTGERACCISSFEFADDSAGSCEPGHFEKSGCEGEDCQCGGTAFWGTRSNGTCIAVSDCGGLGERACCTGSLEAADSGVSCDDGLVEQAGCEGDCQCGGAAFEGTKSSGTCVEPAPCGGNGERGCCTIFGESADDGDACDEGLVEVSGCDGHCLCGGSTVTLGAKSSSSCQLETPASDCGGENQRACCLTTYESAEGSATSCEAGLAEIPGCAGDCSCGGYNPGGIDASGVCVKPSDCGGEGQRACCTGTLEFASNAASCEDGLTEVPGCVGECFCGGSVATSGVQSDGMCVRDESIDEPGTDWTAPASAPLCPLRGYVDMHMHQFAEHAHGGNALAGRSYDEAGINAALASDADLHGDHGILDDPLSFGSGDGARSNNGAPSFNGWPLWTSTTHQQVYYRWLERAWRGGLRLMSQLAVTNEALCEGGETLPGTDCTDSMASIDTQIDAAFAFEAWLDDQYGGAGEGWYRIVTTPAEAREAIAAGKLAVVLGIEVDNLFNCKFGECDQNYVRAQLQAYFDRGIRHIFPVHNFDNAFGGTATWDDLVNVGNRVSEGFYYDAEECSDEGYGFALTEEVSGIVNLFSFGELELPDGYDHEASCNVKSLSGLGEFLLEEMMDLGMLIDVDHMGRHSLDRALEMAEARDYPVLASHTLFFDLHQQDARTERMRTTEQLARIRALGGMIAPILEPRDVGLLGDYVGVGYGSDVENDCRSSSKSLAQAFGYAVDSMGGAVGFGTDFNGIASHTAPRFGPDACNADADQRAAQIRGGQRLPYPFSLDGFGSFERSVTGQRTFDYNTDGLAHVGLLPDMVADMELVGLSAAHQEALWASAQGFIETWERAAGTPYVDPTAVCADVTVSANASCQAEAEVAVGDPDADPLAVVTRSHEGPFSLGATDVRLDVTALCSEVGDTTCTATVTVEDTTGPVFDCPSQITQQCNGVPPTAHYAPPTASDNCSAEAPVSCDLAQGAELNLGTTTVSCEASDDAGNVSTCAFPLEVVDTQRPSIDCTVYFLECNGAGGTTFDPALPAASDNCGEVTVTGPGESFAPLGFSALPFTATDEQGLTRDCNSLYIVQDSQPPVVSCPALHVVECTGGGEASVVPPPASAIDACHGGNVTVTAPATRDYGLGVHTLQYQAEDPSDQQGSCTTELHVVDTLPPTMSAAISEDVLWPADGNMRELSVTVQASDVCQSGTPSCQIVSVSDDEGSAAEDITIAGALSLRLRAERDEDGDGRSYSVEVACSDASGNTSTQSLSVEVPLLCPPAFDAAAPEISCPADQSAECTGDSTAFVTPAVASATDDCTPVSNQTPAAADFGLGTTPVTHTATDGVGNSASCQSAVTVVDTQSPVISGLSVDTPILWPADGQTRAVLVSVEASDSCTPAPPSCAIAAIVSNEPEEAAAVDPGNPLVAQLPATRDDSGTGRVYNLEVVCTDTAGNSTSDIVEVSVPLECPPSFDVAPPQISCPATLTAECQGDDAAQVTPGSASATDDCTGVSVIGPVAGSYPLGSTTVHYTATDGLGQASSCSSEIVVADTAAPTIAGIEVDHPVLWPADGATRTVHLSVDARDSCSAAAPSCEIVGVSDDEGANGGSPTGALSAELVAARDEAGNGREYSIEVRCSDPSGNATTVSTAVEVPLLCPEQFDFLPPELSCPAPTSVACNGNGFAQLTPPPATATDDCTAVAITQAPEAIFPVGTTPTHYSAVDGVGRSSSCQSSVTVVDDAGPEITSLTADIDRLWPADGTERLVTLTVDASDACVPEPPSCEISQLSGGTQAGPLSVYLSAAAADDFEGLSYDIEVRCADGAGNFSTAMLTVEAPPSMDGVLFELSSKSDWGTGYCNRVDVTNTRDEAVEWATRIDLQGGNLNSASRANAFETPEGHIFEGKNWNGTLQPGGSTHFSYCASRCFECLGDEVLRSEEALAGLSVTTQRSSDNGQLYCDQYTVTNNGDGPVRWLVRDAIAGDVESIWNATFTDEGEGLLFEGTEANEIIFAGATRSFGFCARRCFECDDPLAPQPNPSALEQTTERMSDWGAGYCEQVTVTNTSDALVDWHDIRALEGTVTQVWDASATEDGGVIRFDGLARNDVLLPGESLGFGYCVER